MIAMTGTLLKLVKAGLARNKHEARELVERLVAGTAYVHTAIRVAEAWGYTLHLSIDGVVVDIIPGWRIPEPRIQSHVYMRLVNGIGRLGCSIERLRAAGYDVEIVAVKKTQ